MHTKMHTKKYIMETQVSISNENIKKKKNRSESFNDLLLEKVGNSQTIFISEILSYWIF